MFKILVIDDDAEIRQTLVHILEDEGHTVVVADDGRAGLREYGTSLPDLVITDIFMPNQEGFETIRDILSIKPDAKIIATSGGAARVSKDFYLRLAQNLGAVATITKPFEVEDLVNLVNRWLPVGEGKN